MKRYWLQGIVGNDNEMTVFCKTNNIKYAKKKLEELTLDKHQRAFVFDCVYRRVDCANYNVKLIHA